MKPILVVFAVLMTTNSYCQDWNSLNDVALSNNRIHQLKIYNDTLFIGGVFSEVNDVSSSGIILWDSTSIHLKSESQGVYAEDFVLDTSGLFVVGSFNMVDNNFGTTGVVQLVDGVWQSVGGGGTWVVDTPDCCIKWNDSFYVGHGFSGIGGVDVPFSFASWDGTSWHEEESVYGLEKGPMVMTIYNGELIGGGNFNQTTLGDQMFRVGRFDGTHWHDIMGGVNGTVYDLYVDGNDLYVGGTCTLAQFGDVEIPNNIARFDGSNWFGVGEYDEIGNTIWAITKYREQLYVGGLITVNGVPFRSLAYFDGVHWHEVPGSEDMDERVRCLEVYKDELYIGGDFQHAGGLEVPGLVRYFLHPDSVQWGVPDFVEEEAIKSFSIFPNPVNEQFNIQFNQQLDGDILITDISGKQCYREPINGRNNMNINTAALPKGTLLVSQLLGGKLFHTSRVIVN